MASKTAAYCKELLCYGKFKSLWLQSLVFSWHHIYHQRAATTNICGANSFSNPALWIYWTAYRHLNEAFDTAKRKPPFEDKVGFFTLCLSKGLSIHLSQQVPQPIQQNRLFVVALKNDALFLLLFEHFFPTLDSRHQRPVPKQDVVCPSWLGGK